MPSPVTPDEFTAVIPSESADICTKLKSIFLVFPRLVRDLVAWMIDDNGTLTEEFKESASIIPVGTYIHVASDVEIMGWLYCNGKAVSRTTYAALFAVIGTQFGTGDGSTTFNLPDLRARFLLGANASDRPVGSTGGNDGGVRTLNTGHLPPHTHTFTGRNYTGSGNLSPNFTIVDDDYGTSATTVTTSSVGSGSEFSIMPPYLAAFVYIKY